MKGYKKSIFNKYTMSCIPNNTERYLSFTIDNLKFIDFCQFLNASLDSLATNLNQVDFIQMSCHTPADKSDLMTRKRVFCYDYWDGLERASESSLPPREAFYSQLKEEDITEDEYEHDQRVWTQFQLKSLGEYQDFLFFNVKNLVHVCVFCLF